MLHRAKRRDLGQVRLSDEQDFFHAARGRGLEQLRAIGLGLAEKSEGIWKVVDRQPGFFGKALRGEIIGVAPRRRGADLDQTRLDAAFEVGIDESERDPELGGQQPLWLRPVLLHGVEQPEHDPRAFRTFFAHATHVKRSPTCIWYAVHRVNVKARRSKREHISCRF